MKKSILFIIPSLGSGGAEKSLVTLLGLLDYEKYDVDLMLFRREGFFLKQVPPQVNVIDGGEDYRYFDGSIKTGLLYFIKHGKLKLAAARINYMFALKNGPSADRCRLVWKYLSRALPALEKNYDVSVGYLEGNSIYFCVDRTNAAVKIGYIHTEYEKLETDAVFDSGYFSRLTALVTVSGLCAESLARAIPSAGGKTVVIGNIISEAGIKTLSVSEPVFDINFSGTVLLTVGRISYEKGIDIAVKAASLLASAGYDFRWYVIGSGDYSNEIERLIREAGLEERFILLGLRQNPYKYMAQCSIYVQPSRYEGKSIAVEEAKILSKPVVSTNFITVSDQIKDGVTGIIAEIDPVSLAKKIKLLLDNPELGERISENLRNRASGNIKELEKFYHLIN